MNQTNAVLTHVIGKESKIVVRKSSEVTQSDFFFSQYRHAIKVTEKIVENADASSKETTQFENVNNIIAFIGDRGSGKTSCMLTFANILVEGHDVIKFESKNFKTDFYQLPAIDPSFFSEDYNIIGAYIATIYRTYQMLSKSNQNNEKIEQGKVHDFYKALADAQRSFGRLSAPDKDRNDDMERLEQLSCSMKLKEDIKVLTDSFLDCAGHSNGTILLCIDDIDLNTNTAVDMVEWIRKYLIQPNIIILFAVKLDQLINLKRLKLFSEYKDLLDKGKISESELDEMSERYMAKLIPLSNRIYMPEMESLPFIRYQIRKIDDTHTINNSTTDNMVYNTQLRNVIVQKIFEKTRFLFYNSQLKTNMIVPCNLREALHLMRMLNDMEDLPYFEFDKSKEDDEKYQVQKAEYESNRERVLRWNQKVFKEYLFEDCLNKNLTSDSRNLINDLLSVTDSTQFNSTILRILKVKFSANFKRIMEQKPTDDSTEEFELYNILDNTNATFNISMGDTLWILNWLDCMDRSFEESYFIFIVRTIYSMKLFEYYDDLFVSNKKKEIEDEEKGFTAFSHSNYELKNKSNYHMLVAGQLFNPYLCSFIEGLEENRLCKGIVDLKELRNMIINYDYDDTSKGKLLELVMLCTSRPRERKTKEDRYYRKNTSARYSANFTNKSLSAIFDVYSFFYNISDIQSCYNRFSAVFDEKGKETFKKFYNRKDALWRELFNLSSFETISQDGDLLFMRCSNVVKRQSNGFYNENNYSPIQNTENDALKNPIETFDFKRQREWLSWSCFRNTEIYQDFVCFMEGKSRSSETGNLTEKMQHFFGAVYLYGLRTHDFNVTDNTFYRLNFMFAGIISDLLSTKEIKIFDNLLSVENDSTIENDTKKKKETKSKKPISKKQNISNVSIEVKGEKLLLADSTKVYNENKEESDDTTSDK